MTRENGIIEEVEKVERFILKKYVFFIFKYSLNKMRTFFWEFRQNKDIYLTHKLLNYDIQDKPIYTRYLQRQLLQREKFKIIIIIIIIW